MQLAAEQEDQFGVSAIFQEYGDHLGREAELKDQLRAVIKELEAAAREIHTLLQRVHRPGGVAGAAALAAQATLGFAAVQALYTRLDAQLPPNSFWKYSQLWSTTTSWIAFLAALTVYLGSEALATREQVAGLLGLTTTTTMRLDVEEYLLGLCHLSNELSRLTVNCVTSEDYSRPGRVAAFLNSLHTGFRLLNLKNDNLRKKFDSIKYDLKKVEEVVYDLSIRGLGKPEKEEIKGEGGETEAKEEGAEKEVKE